MVREGGAQLRGDQLRRHILWAAKEVFLETGYERASMDAVATRAGTSKRSLYAHFENKDKLFLAVLDLVGELYLDKLRTPDAYAAEPSEAVTLFCGRFLQLMVWEPQVRTTRLTMTEAERQPASAFAYFEAMYGATRERLAEYLSSQYGLDGPAADALAEDLVGRTVLPRVFRTLFGVEEAVAAAPGPAVGDVDLIPIRRIVVEALPD
ncbi:TetR/AcrR family transcriptional regulator [Amycolatopsis jiangsuensis]|uniref:AcrR family transcriptional regulator n=1 Tax=Amycolatopsis jiangsuensis TaxID=1181879 RepID=A0A840IP58_9PSEU|nr:TetR/AcrR family transcriptional regulator [Amycolatopsis jiangsuensis]MBB4684241.1 AcrR family transcriptional regulator [Amycolatopsis jiangsuensis]